MPLIGAGVKLRRVLGLRTVREYDPFLMLDGFDSTDPNDYIKGFPWHPHRGIETVTYLIEGVIDPQRQFGERRYYRPFAMPMDDCRFRNHSSRNA